MSEDIYNPPKSNLEAKTKSVKRPVLVWVIFIISCLGLLGIPKHFLLISGKIPLEGAAGDYLLSLNYFDHFLYVFNTFYYFYASYKLFRLKKIALKLFLGYIPIMLFGFAYNATQENWIAFAGTQPVVYYSMIFGILLYLFCIYYIYSLNKKGRLT